MRASRRLLYSLGDLTTSVPLTVVSFFQLWFLTDVARLPPAAAGWSLVAAKIWDAVNDPLIGLLSDRFSSRLGRRRGPLLVAAPALGLSFCLLWLVPPLGPVALAAYYALTFILFDTAFTLFHVSYNSLTPEMAVDYDERSSLNGIRMAFSIGGAIGAIILITVLGWYLPEPRLRFALIGSILGLASALPALAVFRATRGLDLPAGQEPRGKERPSLLPAMLEDIKAILGNRPYVHVILLYFLTWTTASLISSVLVYFAAYHLRVPEQANYLVLVAQGSAIAFIPLVVRLCRGWDKRRALIAGCLAWALVQACIALIGPRDLALAYLLAALMGFGIATAYVVPWSMLPDTIDADRAGSGQRREGAHYAFASFFQKLGTAAALWMVSQALAFSGYVTPSAELPFPEQPAAAITALRYAIGAVPCLLLGLAALSASGYRMGRAEQRAARRAITAEGEG
jgi:GPH family glycoside/pentoside/hexuronide:cation symporter